MSGHLLHRRRFLELLSLGGASILGARATGRGAEGAGRANPRSIRADLVVAGGGLGGVAAALAALRSGKRVILTEETDWIGGQLTQQAVPPDEHRWIESHGCTRRYRQYRNLVRQYYRDHYPLT